MGFVVSKFTEFLIHWANRWRERAVDRILLSVEPVTVTVRTCSVVSDKDVVWVSDPETGRRLICVEQAIRTFGSHDQIVLDDVLSLDSILKEDVMAHSVVNNIVFNCEVRHGGDSDSSVVRLMDGVTLDQRLRNSADGVEVDWVSTKLECLTNIEEFSVKNASNARLIFRVVEHDVRAVLIRRRSYWITLILNVSCEKTDFCTHFNKITIRSVPSLFGKVLVTKFFVKSQDSAFICSCRKS
jgi:hypothetical protein